MLPADTDREARIEQLLLSGLDHYFAGQYERAISVWTRVVFLERKHDRARAYIERARSAMAERQRESDELLGGGIAAYNAGDVDAARELLTRAADQGSDTAHVFLDRLNRVAAGHAAPLAPSPPPAPRTRVALRRPSPTRGRTGWIAAGAIAVVAAVTMAIGGLPLGAWISELTSRAPETAAPAPPADPLPVVRSAELALSRARTLHQDGRLHDAMRALERIDIADPLRPEADRLRGQIQQDLLAAAGLTSAIPVQPEGLP